mmetsp:Transcript_36069/g.103779  ORF Transcript_36069/g.103779 Transcript_36069/m.103779 type:complete len:251 (-) Transcript_36069:982-1734(-)
MAILSKACRPRTWTDCCRSIAPRSWSMQVCSWATLAAPCRRRSPMQAPRSVRCSHCRRRPLETSWPLRIAWCLPRGWSGSLRKRHTCWSLPLRPQKSRPRLWTSICHRLRKSRMSSQIPPRRRLTPTKSRPPTSLSSVRRLSSPLRRPPRKRSNRPTTRPAPRSLPSARVRRSQRLSRSRKSRRMWMLRGSRSTSSGARCRRFRRRHCRRTTSWRLCSPNWRPWSRRGSAHATSAKTCSRTCWLSIPCGT